MAPLLLLLVLAAVCGVILYVVLRTKNDRAVEQAMGSAFTGDRRRCTECRGFNRYVGDQS